MGKCHIFKSKYTSNSQLPVLFLRLWCEMKETLKERTVAWPQEDQTPFPSSACLCVCVGSSWSSDPVSNTPRHRCCGVEADPLQQLWGTLHKGLLVIWPFHCPRGLVSAQVLALPRPWWRESFVGVAGVIGESECSRALSGWNQGASCISARAFHERQHWLLKARFNCFSKSISL